MSPGRCSSLSPPEVTISLPSGLIFLILIAPVTHHIPSCSPSPRTTYTTHSRHSAVRISCVCMYAFSHCVFSRWGHMHCVPFSVSQSFTCFVFCRVGFLFFIKGLTCNWTHTSFIPRASSPCRDNYT